MDSFAQAAAADAGVQDCGVDSLFLSWATGVATAVGTRDYKVGNSFLSQAAAPVAGAWDRGAGSLSLSQAAGTATGTQDCRQAACTSPRP